MQIPDGMDIAVRRPQAAPEVRRVQRGQVYKSRTVGWLRVKLLKNAWSEVLNEFNADDLQSVRGEGIKEMAEIVAQAVDEVMNDVFEGEKVSDQSEIDPLVYYQCDVMIEESIARYFELFRKAA